MQACLAAGRYILQGSNKWLVGLTSVIWQGGHLQPYTTELFLMPKMKTKRGAAKRFRVRANGSIKRGQAFKRHILTKKTTKNKRQLRGTTAVHKADVAAVRAMLPFA